MNRILLFVPLAIFAVTLVYFGMGLRQDPSAIPSQMIDRPLPAFDLAGIADGDPGLSNTDLLGQVSLLNVFGSWCPPCAIEHPMLMQISRSGRVPIYGVDWRDEPGAGAAWLARHGNPYSRVGDDAQGRLAIDLGITGAPETFLVDADGRVRHHHVGIITEDVWRNTLLPMIEELERS
ncbi:DsbE family thiol:disulfide interchange protein [Maricaulis maris]|jgi:cytochrome c biogenesis protein CcmG/thiol:disulfide interchange protein DsbE|uniref:DsbE family thiol:disulfide interchange protein n=1 Tax=Maricaulis maris TaxID=74318 RepID=UPI0026EE6E8D|nr:DsbE family thiol:disulfide interchange protein [Maricaulis maris]